MDDISSRVPVAMLPMYLRMQEEKEAAIAAERSFQELFRFMPAANDGTLEAANG